MAFVLVVMILSRSFQKNAKTAQPPSPPSIPVVTAVAKIGNQPIYLIGLGTVTPFETVTVRSRVDGQLMSVGVKEGQMVSADDVIAQIDPRPLQGTASAGAGTTGARPGDSGERKNRSPAVHNPV